MRKVEAQQDGDRSFSSLSQVHEIVLDAGQRMGWGWSGVGCAALAGSDGVSSSWKEPLSGQGLLPWNGIMAGAFPSSRMASVLSIHTTVIQLGQLINP